MWCSNTEVTECRRCKSTFHWSRGQRILSVFIWRWVL